MEQDVFSSILSKFEVDNSGKFLNYYSDSIINRVVFYFIGKKKYDELCNILLNVNKCPKKLIINTLEESGRAVYITFLAKYLYDDIDKLTNLIIKTEDIDQLEKYLSCDLDIINKMQVIESIMQSGHIDFKNSKAFTYFLVFKEEFLDYILNKGLVETLKTKKLSKITVKYIMILNRDKYYKELLTYTPFLEDRYEYDSYMYLDKVYISSIKCIKLKKKDLNR